MHAPSVTLIVSTYNRPGPLGATLRSIQGQTLDDWRALVIGDGCDERTAEAVERLDDDRIVYANLSQRFGEQSGPNSVGLALADSPLLALVNHDDLLLPDHLEQGVDALGRTGADLFVGRTAFARDVGRDASGAPVPAVHRFSRGQRRLADVFAGPFNVFEPCSSWVFTRRLRDVAGPWRPAAGLFRSPLEDWLLRIWRARLRAIFGSEVTVLKIAKKATAGASGPLYGDTGERHQRLARLLEVESPAELRRRIAHQKQLRRSSRGSRRGGRMRRRRRIRRAFYPAWLGSVYRTFGLDVYSLYSVLRMRRRGWRPRRTSLRRTGESLPAPAELGRMVDEVRRAVRSERETHGR